MKHLAPGNRYSAPKDEEQKASAGIVRLSQSSKQGRDAILPGLAGEEEKTSCYKDTSVQQWRMNSHYQLPQVKHHYHVTAGDYSPSGGIHQNQPG